MALPDQVSQRKVKEVLGRRKTVALRRKTRFHGQERVARMFTFAAAYNLVRMRNLQAATA